MNNYFSILFVTRESKLKRNGEVPIYLRITMNGVRAERALKRSVLKKKWNSKKERSTGNDKLSIELNKYLDVVRANILAIFTELKQKNHPITPEILLRKFEGQGTEFKSLLKEYHIHNQKCRELIGTEYVEKTVQRYERVARYLGEFLKLQYQREDISFNEIDHEFITGFEHYLKTVKKCGMNATTKYMILFKRITNLALKNKWIVDDPFQEYSFKRERTNRDFLLEDEIKVLMEKEFSVPRLEIVRDIFIFCRFTGLAYSDVEKLTKEHLAVDSNGKNWIKQSRTKTSVVSSIPLFAIPLELIEKYKTHPKCIAKGTLLPVCSNQRMNSYLKDIAASCGWKKNLTMHMARHTFATIALANKVSLSSVSKMLGHAETRTTEIYTHVLDRTIAEEMNSFTNKFSK